MEVSYPQLKDSVAQTPTPSSLRPPKTTSLSVSSPSPSYSSPSSVTPSHSRPPLLRPHRLPNPIAKTRSALVPVLDVSTDQKDFINIADSNQNDNKNIIDLSYFDSFPPGYRFCPSDEELVIHYLKKKVTNQPLPRNKIMEVNLYRYNPEKLAEEYRHCGEKEWYFFTPRDKKYKNGSRPNRAAGDGYWKATGADKAVKCRRDVVGYRKALVFYKGKPLHGDKTNWIMHEYRVNDAPVRRKRNPDDMRLDDWVLCRIYKKSQKLNIRTTHRDEEEPVDFHPSDHNDASDHNDTSDHNDFTDHLNIGGMDVDWDSDSTGYTLSDLVRPFSIPDESTSLSEIPSFENNIPINNGNDELGMAAAATSYPYGSFAMEWIQEPVCGRPLQIHSREDIFTSRYVNENSHSLDFKPGMPHNELIFNYTNYFQPNIAPQLDMESVENVMPIINPRNNPASNKSSKSNTDSSFNVNGKWH